MKKKKKEQIEIGTKRQWEDTLKTQNSLLVKLSISTAIKLFKLIC